MSHNRANLFCIVVQQISANMIHETKSSLLLSRRKETFETDSHSAIFSFSFCDVSMRFHSPLPNAAKLLGEGNKEEERGCHQKKGSRQSKHSQVRKMSAKLWSFQACLQKNPHPNQSQDPCIHITTFQIISRQLTTPQRAETVQLYFQGERNVYGIEGISEAEVPVLISSKPHNNQLIITSNCKLLLPKNC